MIFVRNTDNGDEFTYQYDSGLKRNVLVHLDPQEAALCAVAYGNPHETNTGGLAGIPVVTAAG